MFRSLKFFVGETVDREKIARNLVAFGYHASDETEEEGDFSRRGGIIDIFPANFDSPIRIELSDDKIQSIATIDLKTKKNIWQHQIVIVLPKKIPSGKTFLSETPLSNFVDIEKGDYVVHNQHGIGRFLGIKEFEIEQAQKEHLIIEYTGGDKLYVPKRICTSSRNTPPLPESRRASIDLALANGRKPKPAPKSALSVLQPNSSMSRPCAPH